VEASLLRMTGTPSPTLRQRTILMELERLDAMQKAHYASAVQGAVPATVCVLKIMERRAKLLGLDAPVRIDDPLRSDESESGSDTAALLRELERIAMERGAKGAVIEGEAVKE
jgi:hypothetical protein